MLNTAAERKDLFLQHFWQLIEKSLHDLLECGWVVVKLQKKKKALECEGNHDTGMLFVFVK